MDFSVGYNPAKETCIKFLYYVKLLIEIKLPQWMNDSITKDIRKLLHNIKPIIEGDVFTGDPLLDFVSSMELIDIGELDNTPELSEFLYILNELRKIAFDWDNDSIGDYDETDDSNF